MGLRENCEKVEPISCNFILSGYEIARSSLCASVFIGGGGGGGGGGWGGGGGLAKYNPFSPIINITII